MLWLKISIIILITFSLMVAAVLFMAGKWRRSEKNALIAKMLDASPTMERPLTVDLDSLKTLPKPVKKYFRYALTDGQHFIGHVMLTQVGKLKMDPKSKKWSPFQASQLISQGTVSFIWDAKILIAPFVHIRVSDCFLKGIGSGKVSLMSAFTLDSDEDKPALNSGALYRYLAEAVWHPTALLPESGVEWEAVDAHKAIAHLTKFGISASLEFRFNDLGEITGIYTEDRFGKFGDTYIKYPWEGHFGNYQTFNGMKIPTEGEVGWHLPEGWWLFWKGKIVNVEFE